MNDVEQKENKRTEQKRLEKEKRRKLEMPLSDDDGSKGFLLREAEWEMMLEEEAERKLLATSSKKSDEAKKTKAQAERARLEGEERAGREPVYKNRSLMADRNREMLEAIGELADKKEKINK
jgi:hypothetical protein